MMVIIEYLDLASWFVLWCAHVQNWNIFKNEALSTWWGEMWRQHPSIKFSTRQQERVKYSWQYSSHWRFVCQNLSSNAKLIIKIGICKFMFLSVLIRRAKTDISHIDLCWTVATVLHIYSYLYNPYWLSGHMTWRINHARKTGDLMN